MSHDRRNFKSSPCKSVINCWICILLVNWFLYKTTRDWFLKECEANLDFHLLFLILIHASLHHFTVLETKCLSFKWDFSSVRLKVKPPVCLYYRRYIRVNRFEMVYFSYGVIFCHQTDNWKNITALKYMLKQSGRTLYIAISYYGLH